MLLFKNSMFTARSVFNLIIFVIDFFCPKSLFQSVKLLIKRTSWITYNGSPFENECSVQHWVLFSDRLFLVEDKREYRTHGWVDTLYWHRFLCIALKVTNSNFLVRKGSLQVVEKAHIELTRKLFDFDFYCWYFFRLYFLTYQGTALMDIEFT